MLFVTVFFWFPAALLWYLASKNVENDMTYKSRILSERKQVSLIDYIFELEIQMDRAIQKVQDSRYYIHTNQAKFNELLEDALKIFKFCEHEGESRSITNIEKKAHIIYLRVLLLKHETDNIFKKLNQPNLAVDEINLLKRELSKNSIRISEWEKSTFGEIQTYYEDASLKIIEARLNRKKHLIKGLGKISEAIQIYERIKYLLNERLEIVEENQELSEDETIIRDKEQELYDKCIKSLNATIKLKEEIEYALNQLKEKGIQQEDLRKISDLTQEYEVDLYDVIVDTFKQDDQTKKALIDTLEKIDDLFADPEVPIEFINFLEKNAGKSQLSIEISPMAKKETEPWPSLSFQISTVGSFSNFLKFLEKLETGPYLIEISNLNVKKITEKELRSEKFETFSLSDVNALFLIKVLTR